MTQNRDKIVRVGFALALGLGALAFILPRVLPFSGSGFDAAANAAVVFLLFFGAAGLVALLLAGFTLWQFRQFGWPSRIFGCAPALLTLIGGLVMVGLVLLARA